MYRIILHNSLFLKVQVSEKMFRNVFSFTGKLTRVFQFTSFRGSGLPEIIVTNWTLR